MNIDFNERNNFRKLNHYIENRPKKSVFVLLYYKYFSKKNGFTYDTLVISVNSSNEILSEFKKCIGILQRQQVTLKWYKTSNNKPTFNEMKYGRKTA